MNTWKSLMALMALMLVAPAAGQAGDSSSEGDSGGGDSIDGGPRRRPPHSRGAPIPVAGAGLPILLAAGAYWVVRRRMRRAGEKPEAS